MFINKNFSDDCRAISIETLDTQCDDIFEIDNQQVNQLLRGLKPQDIYYYPNHDKVAYTYVCDL